MIPSSHNGIYGVLLTLLVAEYFFNVPLVSRGRALMAIAAKSVHVVLSKKISDHWKEIVLLRYSREVANNSFAIAIILLGGAFLLVLPAKFLDLLFATKPSIIDFLLSLSGVSIITIVTLIYIYVRNHFSDIYDYSFIDRLLHRFVLGVPLISKASFEFDGIVPIMRQNHLDGKQVFISGLARAGTTILMRTFYDTGHFRSLTYRDMPFVLMPVMWKKLSKSFQNQGEAKIRAHEDGILVDFDSPEAFEEVFWRTFSGETYITENGLQPHTINSDLIDQFRLYVYRIVNSSDDSKHMRYLSKNNNNILRLSAIRKAFPHSLIIIPFRDPLQQAISLLNQHQRFYDMHLNDKFTYDYMRWLGHHEFGVSHKPFRFDKESECSLTAYEVNNVNYWLTIWINTYRYLLANAPSDSIFVSFEALCKSPVQTLRPLFKLADIVLDEYMFSDKFNMPQKKVVNSIDENLDNMAYQIYQDLLKHAFTDANNDSPRDFSATD